MKRHFSIIFLVAIALSLTLYLISKVELKMKNVFIVEVSDSKIPVFPEACVVCRQPQSEQLGTIQMAVNMAGSISIFIISSGETGMKIF
jgi:hypothetical protein